MTSLQEGLTGVRVVQSFAAGAGALRRLPRALARAGLGVAAHLARQHRLLPDDRVRAGARARGGARRRRLPRAPRARHRRDGRRVRALPHLALRPGRAARRLVQRVPVGPRRAREDRRRCSTTPVDRRRRRRRAARERRAARGRRHVRVRRQRAGRRRTSRSTVAPGEHLALVGATGAGKSTLAKLLVRAYDPQRGRGLASAASTCATRRSTSCAAHRLRPAGGPPVLRVDRRQRAARRARTRPTTRCARRSRAIGALERFEALPDGLATDVRSRGVRLSSGERQLVSIARVALVDPAVIVLDEATSSLDPQTEAAVEQALAVLAQGRTVITIAHRLSTAERADRVAVMEHGRLSRSPRTTSSSRRATATRASGRAGRPGWRLDVKRTRTPARSSTSASSRVIRARGRRR